MAEDEPQCKVEYLDVPEGGEEVTNWIRRAGRCKVTYPNNDTFEGNFCDVILRNSDLIGLDWF